MRIGLSVAVAWSGKARLIGDSALGCGGCETRFVRLLRVICLRPQGLQGFLGRRFFNALLAAAVHCKDEGLCCVVY
jgi:hypothetical protein